MLDSPPICHKHDFLMGYKRVVCNTGGPGFDSTMKRFFYNYYYQLQQATFSILKIATLAFQHAIEMPADSYIKIVQFIMQYTMSNGLFGVYLYGFSIINVDENDETSGCNSLTG